MADERTLVAAALAGDPAGRAAMYDAYGDGLHTYCLTLLGDHDNAAEALHDTFVIASQHIGRLRDPERLRAWLYALARNECQWPRGARRRSRLAAVTSREGSSGSSEFIEKLERDLRRAELGSLLWPGAAALPAADREILELSVRHGLQGSDLSAVLRVPPAEMQDRLALAWRAMERALTVRHVVETGEGCRGLRRAVRGSRAGLSPRTTQQAAEHIEGCSLCEAALPRDVGSLRIDTLLPMVPPPRALRDRILGHSGARRLARRNQEVARRGGRFDTEGFPLPYDRRKTRGAAKRAGNKRAGKKWVWLAATLVPGVLVATGVAWYAQQSGGPRTGTPAFGGVIERRGAVAGPWLIRTDDPGTPAPVLPGVPDGYGETKVEPWTEKPIPVLPGAATPSDGAANPSTSDGDPSSNDRSVPPRSPTTAPPGSTPETTPPATGRVGVWPEEVVLDGDSEATLTLKAPGDTAVEWSANPSDPWLTLSATEGTLAPGEERRLTITVDRSRTPSGRWEATIEFTPGPVVVTVTGTGPTPSPTPTG